MPLGGSEGYSHAELYLETRMTSSAITIPPRLASKLAEDLALRSMVEGNIGPFESWYQRSGMPFFTEYTDHGPKHVSGLLLAASSLIPDATLQDLSPADVTVFALAAILHDVGMHLTEDGFVSLINPATTRELLEGLGDKPWHEIWDEFLDEASHFDEKRIWQLFGDGNLRAVKRPSDDWQEWDYRDRKIIGEFIRRHHPRLSHEIAVFGVPGPGNLRLEGVDPLLLDLVGFVARSHGLSLRDCFGYLDDHFHLREFRGAHPIYLMVLLRIADYLQVQSDRAPKDYLQVQSLRSPLSAAEWKSHDAIVSITTQELDPEVIVIDARPKDIKTYLSLKRLFEGIQAELDASWAVLGEVYGRFNGMPIRLRRVRSSLDNKEKFARSVKFIPRPAALTVSKNASKLLSLLVEPLYGNHPEIAIRELLQNAVDAVRERNDYLLRREPEFSDFALHRAPQSKKNVDAIVVSVEKRADGSHCLIVSDGGIGMTADTITDYFLTAGASFRESEFWRKHHTAEGHSRVMRSGRFGIGVLACFLVGNTVKVRTRHISCPPNEAIQFEINPLEEVFELRKTTAPIGTRIEIDISQELYAQLADTPDHWFWYFMDEPAVLYCVNGRKAHFWSEHNIYPQGKARVPGETVNGYRKKGWRRIEQVGYPVTDFAYDDRAPALTCNGIRVLDGWPRWRDMDESAGVPATSITLSTEFLPFGLPVLSIHDPDGLLPLGIRRVDLTRVDNNLLQLIQSIRREVAEQVASDWAKQAPRQMDTREHSGHWMLSRGIYELYAYKYQIFMYSWCAIRSGVTLLLPTLLRKNEVRRVFFLDRSGWESIPPLQRQIEADEAVIAYWLDSADGMGIFREFIADENYISNFMEVDGCAVLLPRVESPTAVKESDQIPYFFKNRVETENYHVHLGFGFSVFQSDKWSVYSNTDEYTCKRITHWADLLAQHSNRWQMAGVWSLKGAPSTPRGWRDSDIADSFMTAFKGPAVRW